jgi:hypothetical protein
MVALSMPPTLSKALADAWAACRASLLNLGLGVMTYLQKITFIQQLLNLR